MSHADYSDASQLLREDIAGMVAGSGYSDAVHQLLAVVRTQLGMQVAWVSEFLGPDQVLTYVDASPDAKDPPAEGDRLPLTGSFCSRVLDGRFPALIPDARVVPEAALLDVTASLHIGSYVGVPLLGPQGVATGMLCAINETASPGMSERDVAALQMLARLLRDLQQRALSEETMQRERTALFDALRSVVAGEGRHTVLQPIVDLASKRVVAAEGLTRFTVDSPLGPDGDAQRSPAQWFDDAARLGMGSELEIATARSVLDRLEEGLPEGLKLSINLGADVLLGTELAPLLDGRQLSRIIIELTEHAPVSDYDRLAAALRPYRKAGLQVAIDDAGAGYASLRHVLAVRPDLVKIDMALVRGVDSDLVRRTLLSALAAFATSAGCRLVAEGVETAGELGAVAECGVDLVQGYYVGRPSRAPDWKRYRPA